jgi:uncharacterized protein YbjT (DUF2867 family)/CTP:molybdopterin cytidylyltransferase MocA
MRTQVAGVVLAAGAGSRYGMPKVLASEGRWLRAAVAALHGGGCEEVVVVLGAAIVDVPAPARAVVAHDWADGLSASLRAGISAIELGSADYAVLITVDTPDITAAAVRRVLAAARMSPSGLARAGYGQRPGHPVVVARRHWNQLVDRSVGDEGGRAFLRGRSDVAWVDCSDLATGADIDVNPAVYPAGSGRHDTVKITVIGASGLIGSKVVALLTSQGHEVVGASRDTGADVLTGAGLADALAGANVLVDVVNSPSFEDDPVMNFFTTSATNLAAAARKAGVGHYVALSIVGLDGLPDSGYMRAKVAQEKVITDSGLPYTLVRATQFAEFADGITESLIVGDEVRVPDALIQPIAASQVAAEVARAAVAEPLNDFVNIGGPEKISFEQMARDALARKGDGTKTVVVDPDAKYFGTALEQRSLVTPD